MLKFCAIVISGLALISVSHAQARVSRDMEPAFGNTIVSQYPDGGWVRHMFDRDGNYRAVFSDGRQINGQWSREGDKLCLNNIRPRFLLSRFCSKFYEVEMGDTWVARDPLGRRVRNELIAGRSS